MLVVLSCFTYGLGFTKMKFARWASHALKRRSHMGNNATHNFHANLLATKESPNTMCTGHSVSSGNIALNESRSKRGIINSNASKRPKASVPNSSHIATINIVLPPGPRHTENGIAG